MPWGPTPNLFSMAARSTAFRHQKQKRSAPTGEVVGIAAFHNNREYLVVIRRVLLHKRFITGRQLFVQEDRIRRAHTHARATVNAVSRIHIKLLHFFKLGFVLARMNTVGRTRLNAKLVFGTGVNNCVGHDCILSIVDGLPPPFVHYRIVTLSKSTVTSITTARDVAQSGVAPLIHSRIALWKAPGLQKHRDNDIM